MKTLIGIMLLVAGCGSSGGEDSTGTNAKGTSCPVGSWVALNYSDRITVGNDGLVTINMNAGTCISTGYVTCTGGQSFVMDIQSKSQAAPYDDDCQKPGVYSCTVSMSSNMFTIYCPGDNSNGNKFRVSKEYQRYQF